MKMILNRNETLIELKTKRFGRNKRFILRLRDWIYYYGIGIPRKIRF